jgi:hypothetical protein
MKIKKARRALRGQLSDLARKQFDEYVAKLKPGFWARLRGQKYLSKWRETRITAFIRWQNRNLKRIAKKAERSIAYAKR